MQPKLQNELFVGQLSHNDRAQAPMAIVSPNLLPYDGIVTHHHRYFATSEANELFEMLIHGLPWSQENARFFGKSVPLPRLTSWHGPTTYAYSGIVHPSLAMTPALGRIQATIEPVAHDMNCVLANLYRHGRDSMSWHADNDTEWGPSPTICSVSFGATRRFLLKHRKTGEKVTLELGHGDVVIMAGTTQEHWLHAIPKTSRPVASRINLTFRRHI